MRRIFIATVLVLLLVAGGQGVIAANQVNVTIDGVPIEFADQPPVIVGGSTLVPIRAPAEHIRLTVVWNQAAQTVNISSGEKVVGLQPGNNQVSIADLGSGRRIGEHSLDVPPQIINGRLLLPIRAVMEEFGCTVSWNAGTRTVEITTSDATWAQMSRTIVIGE